MGSIIKEKNGTYTIRWEGKDAKGNRKQKKERGLPTRPIAKQELKKREGEVASGKRIYNDNMFLCDFLDYWLKKHASKRAPKTYEFYETSIRKHIKPYFIKKKLRDLTGADIESFYEFLATSEEKSNIGNNTIKHIHDTLRAALNKAVKWEYLHDTPMKHVEAPSHEKPEISFWEPDIIPIALELFKGSPIEWHVKVALCTGLRIGEICALDECKINFKRGTFLVNETYQYNKKQGHFFKNTKTDDSTATLPLTDQITTLFKEKILSVKKNRLIYADIYDHTFDGKLSVWEDGRMMTKNYISNKFREILKAQTGKNKVPVITFHDLRHSCASWLLYNGEDLKTVQEILRHSKFELTANTYGHVVMKAKKSALDKLDFNVK